MKKSDIYEIAVKILGLYLFVIIIGMLKDILISIPLLKQGHNSMEEFHMIPIFLASVFNLILIISFALLLLIKTKFIVRKICSPEDYNENARLFVEKNVIYEIALVLTGLLLIIWTFPDFAFRFKNFILFKQNEVEMKANEKNFIIISSLKIVVGILVIIYAKQLGALLGKDKSKVE